MKEKCSECHSTNQYHAKACSRFVSIKGEIRTDEEYQKILDSGNYPNFDISDLQWIDMNVSLPPATASSSSHKGF